MNKSNLLLFESIALNTCSDKTNRAFGNIRSRELATWLAARLSDHGMVCVEITPMELTWLILVRSRPHRTYIVCAGEGTKEIPWRVYAFVQGGTVAKLLGRDRSLSDLNRIFNTMHKCIRAAPEIHGLSEIDWTGSAVGSSR